MGSWVSGMVAFLADNPHLAYAAVLLLALSEAVPLVGAAVPGTAVIVAMSALVPSGVLQLWPLLLAATAGAILGDGLSFWLGHRYHRQILAVWPLSRYPDLVSRSESFLARHGNKSVFLARFTPGVRAVVPLMAGVLHMPARRFYVANVTSAGIWAPAHILPGVLIGASIGALGSGALPIGVLVVVLGLALWLTTRLVRLGVRRGIPLLSHGTERARVWAGSGDTSVRRVTLRLLDPEEHEARVLAAAAAVLAGAAWLFLGVLEDVVTGDPLVRADAAIYRALQDLRSPPGDAVMVAVTELGDTAVTAAVALAVLLWLAWRRAWRTAGYWLVAVAGASALNVAIKSALHRPRPGPPLHDGASAFSFPSGHSTATVVLYGFLAFLVAREAAPRARVALAVATAAFVLLVALSRLYLGAHWLSDVVGGLAFGTALLTLLGLLYMRKPEHSAGPVGLALTGILALTVAGGANVFLNHAADTVRYATISSVPTMTADQWLSSGWLGLPAYRIDLTGEIEEPLTVQWAGDPAVLAGRLSSRGWTEAAPWNATTALAWLTDVKDPLALPVMPRFSGGRLPRLMLVRSTDRSSRLVLRLWAADIAISDGETRPLWVGSVVEESVRHPLGLATWVSAEVSYDGPRDIVAAALRPEGSLLRRPMDATAKWDGGVLVADETTPRQVD